MQYLLFVNFRYLVNFVGICSVMNYIVQILKLMEKKKFLKCKNKAKDKAKAVYIRFKVTKTF